MGFKLGGNYQHSSSSETIDSTKAGQQQYTYTPEQTALQSNLIGVLNQLLQGPNSPQIQALQTQSANQINSEYQGVGDRMNRFLAARGFGKSGQAGEAQLRTELGRQGALAGNSASYGQAGLQLLTTGLSDALTAGYKASGQTWSEQDHTQDNKSGSSFGFGGEVGKTF
jgi:hypothetical protein